MAKQDFMQRRRAATLFIVFCLRTYECEGANKNKEAIGHGRVLLHD
jgi:hypothetical protein